MTPVAWIALGWAAFASFSTLLLFGALLSERKQFLDERAKHTNQLLERTAEAAGYAAQLDILNQKDDS